MPPQFVVLAAIIASSPVADPTALDQPVMAPSGSSDAVLPSVRIDVHNDHSAEDASFLRGALVLRVLDRGYCVTTGAADLVVTLDQEPDQTVVTVADETTRDAHTVGGGGALAALETIHRADAALQRARTPQMRGHECRADAIPVRTNVDQDGELVRNWVGGLSVVGRPLVRGDEGSPSRVCIRREAQAVVIGRGPHCEAVVRIPAMEPGDAATTQLDRAIGAALAVGSEERPRRAPVENTVEPEPEPELEPEPRRTTSPTAAERSPPPTQDPEPRATLHALVAAGAVGRMGGLDGAAVVVAGVNLGPGVIVAGDVTVIPSRLDQRVVAIDTDLMADLGYRLGLSPRSGLHFSASGGARVHSYRIGDGPMLSGRATWLAGAGLSGWWRVGRDLTIELGLQQRFSGQGWLHEVGLDVAGERGRSTTMFMVGVGWMGRRR